MRFLSANYPLKLIGIALFFIVFLLIRIIDQGVNAQLNLGNLWLILGLIFGLLMSVIDRLIYVFLSDATDNYAQDVKKSLTDKKIKNLITLLFNDSDRSRKLATNNVLFLGVWVVLALFLVTTSVNLFAQGLILGLGISLICDVYVDMHQLEILRQRLFWPIKRNISDLEMKIVIGLFSLSFGLITILAL